MTRSLLPLMLDRGAGVIRHVASTAAVVGIRDERHTVRPVPGCRPDPCHRGPIMRSRIRCVAICPGIVETEWMEKIIDGAADPVEPAANWPLDSWTAGSGRPQEIADVVAFVVSPSGRLHQRRCGGR